jgi:hypothetical protein
MRRNIPSPQREINNLELPACFYYALKSVNLTVPLGGMEVVLYTKIGANIDAPTPQKLAVLAIGSARGKAGSEGKDGISYLMSVKRQNINTPLMAQYEKEILKSVGAYSLPEALAIVRGNA